MRTEFFVHRVPGISLVKKVLINEQYLRDLSPQPLKTNNWRPRDSVSPYCTGHPLSPTIGGLQKLYSTTYVYNFVIVSRITYCRHIPFCFLMFLKHNENTLEKTPLHDFAFVVILMGLETRVF